MQKQIASNQPNYQVGFKDNKAYLFKDGKRTHELGRIIEEWKQFLFTPKHKLKNGKPHHWFQKMDAWGCNSDLLTALASKGITLLVFQDLTEGRWYRTSTDKWLKGQYLHFKDYDVQIFLKTSEFEITKGEENVSENSNV